MVPAFFYFVIPPNLLIRDLDWIAKLLNIFDYLPLCNHFLSFNFNYFLSFSYHIQPYSYNIRLIYDWLKTINISYQEMQLDSPLVLQGRGTVIR